MATHVSVHSLVDEATLKTEASAILAPLGLTVSDLVRITLTRVIEDKAVPFDIDVPNELTAETLAKSERGEDLHHFDSAEALFEDLGI